MQKQLLNEILNLVSEYVKQKNKEENDWKEGDWVH